MGNSIKPAGKIRYFEGYCQYACGILSVLLADQYFGWFHHVYGNFVKFKSPGGGGGGGGGYSCIIDDMNVHQGLPNLYPFQTKISVKF